MNTLLSATGVLATMEPRLFDLDFQLLHDSVLTLIAVFVLFLAGSFFFFNPARKFLEKSSLFILNPPHFGELFHSLEISIELFHLHRESSKSVLEASGRIISQEQENVHVSKCERIPGK